MFMRHGGILGIAKLVIYRPVIALFTGDDIGGLPVDPGTKTPPELANGQWNVTWLGRS